MPARVRSAVKLALATRKTTLYTQRVDLWWADEDADYIRGRSTRYPGALNVEPAWTQEVMADEHLVELSPYPSSRVRALGYLGYSPSAGRVLVVIAYRDLDGEPHGMNPWPASGRDLTIYQKAVKDDEEA